MYRDFVYKIILPFSDKKLLIIVNYTWEKIFNYLFYKNSLFLKNK
jgi:hypothetical protein